MNLVVNSLYNVYKLEPIKDMGYSKIPDIIACFLKNNRHILFMLPERWLEKLEKEGREYINERIKIASDQWVLPWERRGKKEKLIWFEPNNLFEINEIIQKTNDVNFICVVADNEMSLDKISYVLDLKEGSKLIIHANIQNDFMDNILPQLKLVIHNLQCRQVREDDEF